jgi:hypothetical protein
MAQLEKLLAELHPGEQIACERDGQVFCPHYRYGARLVLDSRLPPRG